MLAGAWLSTVSGCGWFDLTYEAPARPTYDAPAIAARAGAAVLVCGFRCVEVHDMERGRGVPSAARFDRFRLEPGEYRLTIQAFTRLCDALLVHLDAGHRYDLQVEESYDGSFDDVSMRIVRAEDGEVVAGKARIEPRRCP